MNRLAVVMVLASLGAACSDDGSMGPPPSGGALGQASVEPECGALQHVCLQNGMDAPLAVGASMGIGIDYAVAGAAGPATTLATVNDAVLEVEDAVITGHTEGASALLVVGPEGDVVDFIHVWVAEPTELKIVRHNDEGTAIGTVGDSGTLLVDDEHILSVEAFNSTQGLLGLFDTTWEIEVLEGDAPIALVEDLVFGWYRLVARGPGRARVLLTALGLTRALELEVLP